MPYIETLLKVLEAGLKLWNTRQSRKYQESIMDLKKKRDDELNKGDEMDHAYLDKLERDIMFLSNLFATEIRSEAFKNLQGQ